MRDRLIIAQYGTIAAAVVAGAVVGPARAVGVALAAFVAVVALGIRRDGLGRLP
jgi:hypothetical protein